MADGNLNNGRQTFQGYQRLLLTGLLLVVGIIVLDLRGSVSIVAELESIKTNQHQNCDGQSRQQGNALV